MTFASIILAAGEGTRMRSKLPKVLHPLAGKPLVRYALQAVEGLVDLPPVLVVGHGADAVRAAHRRWCCVRPPGRAAGHRACGDDGPAIA
jgi:bifunctional N-acetylglucosamine-1-phosphate-uridyltransferase/glucosamine-1-phosphate-acetyltransferase GlmU-like protein